ncbi:hypothetical protein WMY93_008135 [Mugilogobius chulae]|uniref:Uncharacterized protein n=1 Tax=Mugilogobius chulae TaxID=88201 RepID=A0AAW0PIK9_9GOBI
MIKGGDSTSRLSCPSCEDWIKTGPELDQLQPEPKSTSPRLVRLQTSVTVQGLGSAPAPLQIRANLAKAAQDAGSGAAAVEWREAEEQRDMSVWEHGA